MKSIITLLASYLYDRAYLHVGDSDFVVSLQDLPLQTNGTDCGVFVCMVGIVFYFLHSCSHLSILTSF